MARTIELRWRCVECGQTNLGRHKVCQAGCGSTREKGEMIMDGLGDVGADGYNRAPTITDPALLALADAGQDWFCTHCSSGNRGDSDRCGACGAARYGKPEEALDTPKPASAPGQRRGLRGGSGKLSGRGRTIVAGAALVTVMCLCAGLLVGLLVWGFTSHEVTGTVTGLAWRQSTTLQRWTHGTIKAWKHETHEKEEIPPIGGRGGVSGMEMIPGSCQPAHYADTSVQCGTRSVPHYVQVPCGESCTSSGNGFAKCHPKTCPRQRGYDQVPKYCPVAIYKDRCRYDIESWQQVSVSDASGRGPDTRWPQMDVGLLDRTRFSASYDVEIDYTDGGVSQKYTAHPGGSYMTDMDVTAAVAAEEAYKTYHLGQKVPIHINNFGMVSSDIR